MKKLALFCLILIAVVALASCGNNGNKGDDKKEYTYNVATNSLPTSWNINTYQSNSSTLVLDYTEDALYTFDYNETKDGFKIVPSMAAAMPEDVTAKYVGKYGITEGETGKAYKISLRTDLKFDNGVAIKASDFVESVKLLMDPAAANYRADNYYSGNLKLVNAENYFKGGKYAYGEFVSAAYGDDEYVAPEDFGTNAEGQYTVEKGGVTYDVALNIYSGGNWGKNGLWDYGKAGYLGEPRYYSADGSRVKYCDAEGGNVVWRSATPDATTEDYIWYTSETGTETVVVTETTASYMLGETPIAWANCPAPDSIIGILFYAADEDGYVKVNAETLKAIQDAIAMLHDFATVEAYAADAGDYAYIEFEGMAVLGRDYEKIDFEEVGIFVDPEDPNAIVICLINELSGFYLNYSLCISFNLVYIPLYNSCISQNAGAYANKYGTNTDTYVGFGPYKLVKYIDGSVIKLAKNEHWYGYGLAENKGLYQTDYIQIDQIADESARLEAFLKGETDSYGLAEADMEDYQNSPYTYFTDGDSTWFIALNPDASGLKSSEGITSPVKPGYRVDKEILTIKDFRMALSFSVDRAAYELALDPLGSVAKALYGNMIISDPENGTAYRTTEEAKDVILKFWGLEDEVGPGKFYESKDEAIASITGYDPAGAKELFNSAYGQAVEAGFIDVTDDKWEIQICIGQPGSGSSAYYGDGYELLKKVWTEAVIGTSLEGHLTFIQSQPLGSTNFSNYLKDNTIDLLFGVGWTGSALDPYGLMEAYVAPNYQYDPAWDTKKTLLDVTYDGKTLRASVYDWGVTCLGGTAISAYVVDGEGKIGEAKETVVAGTTADPALRLAILAAVEGAVLEQYDMIPVGTDASANLKGMQIKYYTEEYVFGMGRGGIKYMTYNYTDAEWDAFVKSNGGTLDYK